MRLERKQDIAPSKQDIQGGKRDIDTIKARSSASSFAVSLLSGYPSCSYVLYPYYFATFLVFSALCFDKFCDFVLYFSFFSLQCRFAFPHFKCFAPHLTPFVNSY